VCELGKKISEDYKGKNLLLVSVLKGSVVFMADLMRSITIPVNIDFMCVSSYGAGVKTSGVVKIIKDLDIVLAGHDILIVEDILDSGMTLNYLREILKKRNPQSIRIATLLDKPERRQVPIKPDYSCFNVPDEFVVGYGLDYDEKYRNLPYIGVLKPRFIQSKDTRYYNFWNDRSVKRLTTKRPSKALECTWCSSGTYAGGYIFIFHADDRNHNDLLGRFGYVPRKAGFRFFN
jgi:hypoxanthine phosphoribosyltransferase